jgi:hypothetical protein
MIMVWPGPAGWLPENLRPTRRIPGLLFHFNHASVSGLLINFSEPSHPFFAASMGTTGDGTLALITKRRAALLLGWTTATGAGLEKSDRPPHQ